MPPPPRPPTLPRRPVRRCRRRRWRPRAPSIHAATAVGRRPWLEQARAAGRRAPGAGENASHSVLQAIRPTDHPARRHRRRRTAGWAMRPRRRSPATRPRRFCGRGPHRRRRRGRGRRARRRSPRRRAMNGAAAARVDAPPPWPWSSRHAARLPGQRSGRCRRRPAGSRPAGRDRATSGMQVLEGTARPLNTFPPGLARRATNGSPMPATATVAANAPRCCAWCRRATDAAGVRTVPGRPGGVRVGGRRRGLCAVAGPARRPPPTVAEAARLPAAGPPFSNGAPTAAPTAASAAPSAPLCTEAPGCSTPGAATTWRSAGARAVGRRTGKIGHVPSPTPRSACSACSSPTAHPAADLAHWGGGEVRLRAFSDISRPWVGRCRSASPPGAGHPRLGQRRSVQAISECHPGV